MSAIQTLLYSIEVGKARALIYLIPLLATLIVIGAVYDFKVYRGLNDAQSMDNAQLARQIAQGSGFTTKFIRPYAATQLHDYVAKKTGDLFPADRFPAGTPRILPDTYNAPGYPYLLAGWFRLIHLPFDQAQAQAELFKHKLYPEDIPIPWLNQIFIILTALFIFALGRTLFDNRVAWIALLAFLASDMIWQYSITALSTSLLMFLITALLFVSVKIFCVAEDHFVSDEPFWPVWVWAIALGFFLVLACLTRLHLLVLLIPLLTFLALIPRTNFLLLPAVAIPVISLVALWFWHTYQICGNPAGSNLPQLLYGTNGYTGNQIFCQTTIPSYEQVLKNIGKKELDGFSWHFEHFWSLLGANPLIFLCAACALHRFKRGRANAFFWLIVGSAFCIVAANNFGTSHPETIDPWNTLVVLFPGMLVIGAAFFFILLDRLDLQLWMLNNLIIIIMLVLTAMPLAVSLSSSSNSYYNYPPYHPLAIGQISQLVHEDEWETSDMPWATAWYGNRASLWLPDSIKDFYHLYDDYCPTGLLLLTPVTLDAPMTNLFSGEYRDWFPMFPGANLPPKFPLTSHTNLSSNGINYFIWSNSERWK
jgi:hypothetical protein